MHESTDAFTGELVHAEPKLLQLAEVSQLPRYGTCTSNRKYTRIITPVRYPLAYLVEFDVLVCACAQERVSTPECP